MNYCVLDSGGAKERGLLIGSEQIIIYSTVLLGFRSVVNFLYRSPGYLKQQIFGTLDDPLIDTRRAESWPCR